MKHYNVEILCTFYKEDEVIERLTFKMPEATRHEYMEKCDNVVYKWSKDNEVDFDDYWFGYRIISREEVKDA